MKKEKYFIDLSKLSEKEIKNIALTLKACKERTYYHELKMFEDGKYYKSHPHLQIWGATDIWGCDYDCGKTELTYHDFIKLFEGGEGEKENIYDVDFGGNVMARIKIVGNKIEVTNAMNGYGNGIPLSEIRITNSK